MKLLLIRHAEPDYSIDSLTPKGWHEAELLSRRLARLPVDQYYVSPLGRARDTLSLTLEKTGQTAVCLDFLREFPPHIERPDRPDEDSIVWDWLPSDWTAEPAHFERGGWCRTARMQAGGVESVYRSVAEGFDSVLAGHGYVREGELYRAVQPSQKTLAFVCHFGVSCVILSHLLGLSPMVLWHGAIALPSSLTVLSTEERREGLASFRMSAFSDTAHLYAAGETPSFAGRFCECFSNQTERHD